MEYNILLPLIYLILGLLLLVCYYVICKDISSIIDISSLLFIISACIGIFVLYIMYKNKFDDNTINISIGISTLSISSIFTSFIIAISQKINNSTNNTPNNTTNNTTSSSNTGNNSTTINTVNNSSITTGNENSLTSIVISSNLTKYINIPKTFKKILDTIYSTNIDNINLISNITNYNKYIINIDRTSDYIGINSTTSTKDYIITLNNLSKNITWKNVLETIFTFIQDIDGNYIIESDLHSNFAIDCIWISTSNYMNTLHGNNNFGTDRVSGSSDGSGGYSGYVTFSYDTVNKYIIAKNRYYYNYESYISTGDVDPSKYPNNAYGGGLGHILDKKFPYSGYYMYYNTLNSTLELSQTNKTIFNIYDSPIDLNIPKDLNPNNIRRVSNLGTSILNKSNGVLLTGLTQITNQINSLTPKIIPNYATQIYTYDSKLNVTNSNYVDNAVYTMLDYIYNTNSDIRYSKAKYLGFRQTLINNIISSNSVANAYLNSMCVYQVYFTNEKDSNGKYHPFMIIANLSVPSGPTRFINVNRPPGDAINHFYNTISENNYDVQYVTRDATIQDFLTKIPMRDYGTAGSITSNGNKNESIMKTIRTLKDDETEGSKYSYDVYNYSSISSCGIACDGAEIYPTLNNALQPSSTQSELTASGHHSGQGLGTHYHADSFQCGTNELNLYNKSDYINQTHPPLVGFGFDGIALFGSYTIGYDTSTNTHKTTYDSMEGYDIQLDEYGAHSHGNYGYHYHAHSVGSKTIQSYTGNDNFTVPILLKGAWAGNCSSIPNFIELDRPSQQSNYVGKM